MSYLRYHPLQYVMLVMTAAALGCDSGEDITEPGSGTLEVTSTTTGPEPDPDGYTVQMDAEPPEAIALSGTIRRTGVAAGQHTLVLSGVAGNCTVAGDNPRTVSVTAGETATVAFTIACTATSGSLRITASTSGPTPDPDGYTVAIDGTAGSQLASNAEATLSGITAGAHSVGLSGVAGNCQVEGDNPRPIDVSAGATTVAAFVVTCQAPPSTSGSLRVTTTTAGTSPDPNGYSFSIDGGGTQPIETNGEATVSNLAVGARQVQLLDVATNCVVEGPNPRSASVVSGATTDVSFAVTCGAADGSIVITTSSSGPRTDGDGYLVSIDGGTAQPIGISAALTISSVTSGSHSVELSEISDLCHVEGENPRTVSASGGSTTPVAFDVVCIAPPAGLGAWSLAAPIPTVRLRAAGAVVQNASGQYLFHTIGGTNPNNAAMQRMEVYNATTDSWSRKADMPVKRAAASAEAIDGKIYVVGGTDLTGAGTNTLYRYDPDSDAWVERASLPVASFLSISGVIKGKLYVLTNLFPDPAPQRLYRYDPSTNEWTRLADPIKDHRRGVGGVINGKLYVAWGQSFTVDVYDPVTDQWNTLLTEVFAGGTGSVCEDGLQFCSIFGAGGAVLHDQLYVIGGLNDDEAIGGAMAYDPVTNSWTDKARMRNQREHSPTAGKVKNSAGLLQIVVVGGRDTNTQEDVVETEKFTP